jgi:amidase/aspartyl-tRNA(Asn)/glutamyl-tRNA(Gln) amidotransferase subunit A
MKDIRTIVEPIDAESPAVAWLPGSLEPAMPGPLEGMPFMVKDVFDVAGWPTTASSTFLNKLRPLPKRDADLVAHLRRLGAVCVGKTHLNEFAYGLSGENPHYGNCVHPRDPNRLCGGSSSGSAYAVVKGWVPCALGTDTGGSIRVPAAFSGCWGIRYVPGFATGGCFPLAPTFDTVGFLAASTSWVRKVDEALHVAMGESGAERRPARILGAFSSKWCRDGEVANWYLAAFAQRGIQIDEDFSEELGDWLDKVPFAFNVLQSLEALEQHNSWLEPYREAYDPAVWRRIERALHWRKEDIEDAGKIRNEFRKWLFRTVGEDSVVAMPTAPCPSPPVEELTDHFREQLLALTTPVSMAGWPALLEPVFPPAIRPLSVGIQYTAARPDLLRSFLKDFAR